MPYSDRISFEPTKDNLATIDDALNAVIDLLKSFHLNVCEAIANRPIDEYSEESEIFQRAMQFDGVVPTDRMFESGKTEDLLDAEDVNLELYAGRIDKRVIEIDLLREGFRSSTRSMDQDVLQYTRGILQNCLIHECGAMLHGREEDNESLLTRAYFKVLTYTKALRALGATEDRYPLDHCADKHFDEDNLKMSKIILKALETMRAKSR